MGGSILHELETGRTRLIGLGKIPQIYTLPQCIHEGCWCLDHLQHSQTLRRHVSCHNQASEMSKGMSLIEGQLHTLKAHHNAIATRLSQCTGLPRATTNLAAYLDVTPVSGFQSDSRD